MYIYDKIFSDMEYKVALEINKSIKYSDEFNDYHTFHLINFDESSLLIVSEHLMEEKMEL